MFDLNEIRPHYIAHSLGVDRTWVTILFKKSLSGLNHIKKKESITNQFLTIMLCFESALLLSVYEALIILRLKISNMFQELN
jgi:hypothetical protein